MISEQLNLKCHFDGDSCSFSSLPPALGGFDDDDEGHDDQKVIVLRKKGGKKMKS